MPFSDGVLRAGGDLVGAAATDEHEGAFVLDHLPADLHRFLRVERVVAEDDADVAAEELVGRALGQELPVDVLADVEARLRDRRRAGDGRVDADDDLVVGHTVGVAVTGDERSGGWRLGVGRSAGVGARRARHPGASVAAGAVVSGAGATGTSALSLPATPAFWPQLAATSASRDEERQQASGPHRSPPSVETWRSR